MTNTEPRPVAESIAAIRKKLADIPKPSTVRPVVEVDEEYQAETDARLKEMRAEAARDRWQMTIPPRFQSARLSDFDPDIQAQVEKWQTEPVNLLILGPVGPGKSRLACAAARDFVDRAVRVVFAPVAEMLDGLRPGGPDDEVRRFMTAGLLIVDDLGLERQTDWSAERIDMLVNRRWLDVLPTIVTTNLEPAALEAHVGPRTYSRLVGSGAVPLRLSGDDRRRS